MNKPSYVGFDHKTYKWSSQIDYEREPQLYEIGRGQQGVLVCEPYKSDISKHWHQESKGSREICRDYIQDVY